MEVTITKTEEQPLLGRKELHARVRFAGATPARHEFMKAIGAKQGCKPELIHIKSADSDFGDSTAQVVALQYKDVAALEKNAPDYLKKRNVIPEPEPEPEPEPQAEDASEEASGEGGSDTEEAKEE